MLGIVRFVTVFSIDLVSVDEHRLGNSVSVRLIADHDEHEHMIVLPVPSQESNGAKLFTSGHATTVEEIDRNPTHGMDYRIY